ncbi:MAG: HEAT repeat domain-containing protein [Acidobacteriota bacterium]
MKQSAGSPRGNSFLDGQESVGELIGLLGHTNLHVRRAAVTELAVRDPSETFPGLLNALSDDDDAAARNAAGDVLLRHGRAVLEPLLRSLDPDGQRDRTIQILGLLNRFPSRRTLESVTPLVQHKDPSVAAAAISCLGVLKDPSSVPVLQSVLDSGERWQSFYAIDALGEIGHAAAINRLLPLITDGYYRKAVLRALGRIGDMTAVGPLARAMRNGTPCPDRTALAALNEMLEKSRTRARRQALEREIRIQFEAPPKESLLQGLLELLSGKEPEMRRHAARALGWLGREEAVSPLVAALAEADLISTAGRALELMCPSAVPAILRAVENTALPPESLRCVVEMVGVAEGEAVEEFLIRAVRHEEVDVRHAAAAALADHARSDHLEVLVEVLGDPSMLVSSEAIRGIHQLADRSERERERVAGRVDGLCASPSAVTRRAALRIIARLGLKGSRESLDMALHDPVAEVRRTAVALMGEDPDPERLWRLAAAMADEDARVREEAVQAVGHLTDERARGVLLASLHDRSLWVRCRAARALASHPAAEVVVALEEATRTELLPVRVSAVEALASMQPQRTDLLIRLAADPEPDVRRAAIRGLDGGAASVDVLGAALEDEVWSVRSAAVEALGKCGEASVFSLLSSALDRERDEVVRKGLLEALYHVDAESALPFLVSALAEKTVSETAVHLLVQGHRVFADALRSEWAASVDPTRREGLAMVLEEIGRRESVMIDDGTHRVNE